MKKKDEEEMSIRTILALKRRNMKENEGKMKKE